MRVLLLGFLLLGVALAFRSAPRKPTLYVAVIETRGGFVVGAANAASGLHRYEGGSTWTPLGWRNVRDFGVAGDPERPEVLYLACGNGAFRSRDGGQSWTQRTGGLSERNIHAVAFDPSAPGRLWVGTYEGGVYHSDDDGRGWTYARRIGAVPHVEGAVGRGMLLMKYDRMRRRLDFEALSITDWVEEVQP